MQLASIPLSGQASAVAVSPDGRFAVAGTTEGRLEVVDIDTMSRVASKPCRRKAVTDLKFSPSGRFCAVAGRDNVVDIRDTKTWRSVGVTKPPMSSAVTRLDWSADNEWIQCTTGTRELVYLSTAGSTQKNGKEFRDTQWDTWTCLFGWPVVGIWPKYANANAIKAVARSDDKPLVATADVFGNVKLLQWPCNMPAAPCHEYCGHSSHVENLCFSADGGYVFSVGGRDRAVFVWSVK